MASSVKMTKDMALRQQEEKEQEEMRLLEISYWNAHADRLAHISKEEESGRMSSEHASEERLWSEETMYETLRAAQKGLSRRHKAQRDAIETAY
jgi:RecA-family ATPase